jgi:hypothetical protein
VLPDKNIKNIEFQIREIDILIKQYKELIEINKKPDIVQITALAGVLHSFYNGLERIFIFILKTQGKSLPSGDNWHKQIVEELFNLNENEELIFPLSLKEPIDNYRAFRHFYRHSYTFYLDWEEMNQMVISLQSNWKNIKKYLNNWKNNKI